MFLLYLFKPPLLSSQDLLELEKWHAASETEQPMHLERWLWVVAMADRESSPVAALSIGDCERMMWVE